MHLGIMRKKLPAALCVVLWACLSAAGAAPPVGTPVGKIIAASGEVVALQADGDTRVLLIQSDLYAGEVMKTGAGARAQLKLLDNALVTLHPGTEFRVNEYRLDVTSRENNVSSMELIKGGLRTLSGQIVEENATGYQLKTPLATISLSDTSELEAVLGAKGLGVAFWSGTGKLSNNQGSLGLGVSEDYKFGQVTDENSAPVPGLNPTSELKEQSAAAERVAAGGSAAAGGLAATKHNLSTAESEQKLCVFCHTPYGSNPGTMDAPRWNSRMSPGVIHQTYLSVSQTGVGSQLGTGSVSLPCLSCHDGTQAPDIAPGGAVQVAGMAGAGAMAPTGGQGLDPIHQWVEGGAANATDGELRSEHPTGVQFCRGGIVGTEVSGCVDPDFKGGTSNTDATNTLRTARVNDNQIWWIDTPDGVATVRERTDIQLFTRTFSDGDGPSVECASCHDPHSGNGTFLRISNAGSAVCFSCHIK